MLTELLLRVAAAAAVGFLCSIFESIWEARSRSQSLPLSLEAELSEYDVEMADRSRELIRECFCAEGSNVVDSIRQMNAEERLTAAQDFAERLAALNGLDIDITFFQDNDIRDCGGYHAGTNTASFNIVELMWDGEHEAFEARILNFLDTIVHEQRHAVQIRAIREKGFWQVDDERRVSWANNLPPLYIRPSVDARAYRTQPVERDAFTYAELVLRGV